MQTDPYFLVSHPFTWTWKYTHLPGFPKIYYLGVASRIVPTSSVKYIYKILKSGLKNKLLISKKIKSVHHVYLSITIYEKCIYIEACSKNKLFQCKLCSVLTNLSVKRLRQLNELIKRQMVWINLATFVAVLIESTYISVGYQQNKKSKQTDIYWKVRSNIGQQKTPLPKENNLPHVVVKSESENPWEDDRKGGGKNVS